CFFFFSSRRRHTRSDRDWSSDVCSSDLSGLFAAMAGVVLGFPVLRLRGDYLAIVTLGFGEMVRIVLINWQSLTGGPNGLAGVPRSEERRVGKECRCRWWPDH